MRYPHPQPLSLPAGEGGRWPRREYRWLQTLWSRPFAGWKPALPVDANSLKFA